MKKTAFIIIGGAVVAGVVAYGVYKFVQQRREGSQPGDINLTPNAAAGAAPETDPVISNNGDENLSEIRERHSEASQIIRESLETIFDEEQQEVKTEIEDTLDSIDTKLDDLLK